VQQWWKVDKLPSPRKTEGIVQPQEVPSIWWTTDEHLPPEEGDWIDEHLSRTELAISVDDQVSWTLIASSKREKMIGNNEPITDWKWDQCCKHCNG
jgi:hypothetical protein